MQFRPNEYLLPHCFKSGILAFYYYGSSDCIKWKSPKKDQNQKYFAIKQSLYSKIDHGSLSA